MRDVAARLIAFETSENQPAGICAPATFRVSEKLRSHLSLLMGKVGFRAVLSRALAVAQADSPCLCAVQVNADGSLEPVNATEEFENTCQIAEGGVLLVAQLLTLLAAFVGEKLTLVLVREVWPKLSFEDSNFTREDHPMKPTAAR